MVKPGEKPGDKPGTTPAMGGAAAAEEKPAAPAPADDPAADDMPPADGMMSGVTPGAKPADDEKSKMLPITTFGRYLKILLSSNEFIFVS
jgi:hypothetical protein